MTKSYWDTFRKELVLPSGAAADNEFAVLASLVGFAHVSHTVYDRGNCEDIVLVSEQAAVAALTELFSRKSSVSPEELFQALTSDMPFEEIRDGEILVPHGGFALVRTDYGDFATVEIYRRGPYYV